MQDRSANNGAQKREGKRELEKGKKPRIGRIVVVYRAEPHKLAKLVQYLVCIQMPNVATDPKITARRYDSDTGSVSFIVFVFPIRYSIKAAQQDSAFKMTHI